MQTIDQTFETTIELMRLQLTQVNGALILVGVTDDTTLRDHTITALSRRLPSEIELRSFRFDINHISLLEGAVAVAEQPNGKRVA
ncbi:MAG: hypothetical protein ACREAM_27255, partial [Blastocatellia bacterium]